MNGKGGLMGRDNSPKNRYKRNLTRKQNTRASYDRILIVSEGSKTEPNYFKEIRTEFRLNTANIEIQPSDWGTAPLQVVNYAKHLFENGDSHKKLQPRAFEQVYVVFDRDEHRTYFDALLLANSLNGKLKNENKINIPFIAIPSIPSFELWLLLHYQEIKHAIHRDDVMHCLKKYLHDYEKGAVNIFARTRDSLDVATLRANLLIEKGSAFTDTEPYTEIGKVVTVLMSLCRV